jgi:aspartyl-tRNA(Asn)/glutamyl-tRNA(Gln) amidotransferase subunit A
MRNAAKPIIIAPMLNAFRPDLHATRQAIASGQTNAAAQMRMSLDIAAAQACANTFRSLNPVAIKQAGEADPSMPLAGLAVSVKDLFDMTGEVSASGSLVLADRPPAATDATAVARLKAAGGVVIGRTHMVEFAFSGMGVNPHFGTPVNPKALACDPSCPRIPGGSSSGAAVSVASGAAFIGLGSDTGGSLRIPAALCGLVGFKPTARTVPTEGAIELSRTLDTVGAITRTVRDAILAYEVLSAHGIGSLHRPLSDWRLAVPQHGMLDSLDEHVSTQFERSISALRRAGAKIVEIALPEISELGSIQPRGGFAAPEIQAWLISEGLWPRRQAEFDPRVAQRIALADGMSATDYVQLQRARQLWIAKVSSATQGFDAMLSPTVPLVAPPIASVAPGAERDAEFFRLNALMLRNTSVVNMLDGCAISVPNHPQDSLPTGLMLWHSAGKDADLLHISQQIEGLIR